LYLLQEPLGDCPGSGSRKEGNEKKEDVQRVNDRQSLQKKPGQNQLDKPKNHQWGQAKFCGV